MLRLFKVIKGKNLLIVILSFFLTLIQVLTDVCQPFLLMFLTNVDPITGNFARSTNEILIIGGAMLGLSIFGFITGFFSIILSSKIGVRFGGIIRMNLLNKIQKLSFSDIDKFQTASLITRLTNDVVFLQNTAILTIRIVVRAFFLFLGGIVLSFVMSPILATVFLASALILLASIWFIIMKAVPYFKKQQREIDKTNTIMRENLLGVRVVKAFNMQHDQCDKFIFQNDVLKNTSTKSQRLMILIIPLILFLVQSSTIAVMMIAGAHPEFANKDIGIIIAFTQIISLIVIGLVSMVVVLMNISSAKASSDRVNEVLDYTPTLIKNETNNVITNSNVEFKNVSFSYFKSGDEEEASIKNISFKVKAGETIGIIGQTGSGKSTLVNLIARMYDVTMGEILISDINVKDINNVSLRENISISPQKTTLFSGTIEDNIKFGNENASFDDIKKACIDAQAWNFIEKKDGQLKATVEQRGTNFSGGQKQRISIARALVKNPKILILDDSTSALDLITEAKVQKALRLYRNTTVFIIGQRISSISRADKIIVMHNGAMVSFGDHKTLLKTCKIYKEIAKSQEMVK